MSTYITGSYGEEHFIVTISPSYGEVKIQVTEQRSKRLLSLLDLKRVEKFEIIADKKDHSSVLLTASYDDSIKQTCRMVEQGNTSLFVELCSKVQRGKTMKNLIFIISSLISWWMFFVWISSNIYFAESMEYGAFLYTSVFAISPFLSALVTYLTYKFCIKLLSRFTLQILTIFYILISIYGVIFILNI
jgi:hypothetical protein